MTTIKTPKKLIEVALPLDDINVAAAREKAIRAGHPSTLHLWWARRPLAAARAVIFSQMVNDPGYERNLGRGVNKEKAHIERERLFGILRRLVLWESTNNESVLAEARAEIEKSWRETCALNKGHPQALELFDPENLPAFHDPFAGGGAIPMEAQRLGLESHASDLNPVAVMINKAMIELPRKVAGKNPVGRRLDSDRQDPLENDWRGTKGLAEDVRRYGSWVRQEAERRIGAHFPLADIPTSHGGGQAPVIAWLWARTVRSPNPAFSEVDVPLASTFVLSTKEGNEAFVTPVIDGRSYQFEVKHGKPPEQTKNGTKASGRGANFVCLLSNTPITGDYIKAEGKADRLGIRLMAVVTTGARNRVYLSPSKGMEDAALSAKPSWRPGGDVPAKLTGGSCVPYGMTQWSDLFTDRQLLAMTTLSELVAEARSVVKRDAISAGWDEADAVEYANAISTYMAFAVDKVADRNSSIATWATLREHARNTFGRQAIPMTWDFAESNPFSDSSGNFEGGIKSIADGLLAVHIGAKGLAHQADAATQTITSGKLVSTDPPYYDNIAYADLSDFFYVWMRRALKDIYPDLFATMVVPKDEELVATAYRHGGREDAEKFFLRGMTQAMQGIAAQAHPAFPTTIYYAFKQSDTTDIGTGNTGWETFLEAVLRAGFAITGTWPMRTELGHRMVGSGTNALASSIVLVCRQRPNDAPSISRRDFMRELKEELVEAVEVMIGGAEGLSPVAPVDLAQAVIGPGMGIFSKYSAVLEADGSPMTVHTALTLINRMLTEGSDDFDSDTQFCMGWFDERGWAAGEFGQADVLARAKGTSVDRVRQAGVVEAVSGSVRLLRPVEYPSDWSPLEDNNTPIWEALHQLSRALQGEGESVAGALLAGMPQRAEPIRNLAYRLYTLCERKGWRDEARGYNDLITSWTGIEAASHEKGHFGSQTNLDI